MSTYLETPEHLRRVLWTSEDSQTVLWLRTDDESLWISELFSGGQDICTDAGELAAMAGAAGLVRT